MRFRMKFFTRMFLIPKSPYFLFLHQPCRPTSSPHQLIFSWISDYLIFVLLHQSSNHNNCISATHGCHLLPTHRRPVILGFIPSDECEFLYKNFIQCLREKSVKDNVPKMTCNVENVHPPEYSFFGLIYNAQNSIVNFRNLQFLERCFC
jgi:hypothetical protein